jgi:alpha-ketoglutarate-dependent taurine dioxygenase
LLKRLYAKQIRYSVMELPFFGFLDALPEPLRGPASASVKSAVSAAINAKVDFDVKMQWLDDSAYGETKTMQARAPVQPPVVLHPDSGEPTWFCNVHSHSSALRKKREATYGAEKFVDGASQINKSDMYYGDDTELSAADLDEMDALTKEHTTYLAMKPGDAVLLDNYQTMHGRNVFKGTRKHAVSWFE